MAEGMAGDLPERILALEYRMEKENRNKRFVPITEDEENGLIEDQRNSNTVKKTTLDLQSFQVRHFDKLKLKINQMSQIKCHSDNSMEVSSIFVYFGP